jgi:hypothetical protein
MRLEGDDLGEQREKANRNAPRRPGAPDGLALLERSGEAYIDRRRDIAMGTHGLTRRAALLSCGAFASAGLSDGPARRHRRGRAGDRRQRQLGRRGGRGRKKPEVQPYALGYTPGVEMPRDVETKREKAPIACGSGLWSAACTGRAATLRRATRTPSGIPSTQPSALGSGAGRYSCADRQASEASSVAMSSHRCEGPRMPVRRRTRRERAIRHEEQAKGHGPGNNPSPLPV